MPAGQERGARMSNSPSDVRDDTSDSSEIELSGAMEYTDTEEFESLLDEVASILETEDGLEVEDGPKIEGELDAEDIELIDSEEQLVDLGQDYFDLRDGPLTLGPAHVAESRSHAERAQAEEARWNTGIQLVDDDVATLDPDDEPALPLGTSVQEQRDPRSWFARAVARLLQILD